MKMVRPLIHKLHPYVPGEQPKIKDLIKLNTNENPYPPSPKVLKAIQAATDERLRLYPNPTAESLRIKLAKFHGCLPENIIIGNGSDELLAMATRAFVEPLTGNKERFLNRVQYFTPSYSLYPVLADIHGAAKRAVPLLSDFSIDLSSNRQWDFEAALTYVTTPNAPSGRGYTTKELDQLCAPHQGVIVLDEAYVDFGDENAMPLALKYPHVLVARTFSKAYCLCFLRVGYFVGHPELIAALQKIRDSYNVNGLGQIAALATLQDLPYYRRNFQRVRRTRERLKKGLTELGFHVFPSQTNFILVRPPLYSAKQWLDRLREKKILVRWFSSPDMDKYLRISIGTDAEIDRLLECVSQVANL